MPYATHYFVWLDQIILRYFRTKILSSDFAHFFFFFKYTYTREVLGFFEEKEPQHSHYIFDMQILPYMSNCFVYLHWLQLTRNSNCYFRTVGYMIPVLEE